MGYDREDNVFGVGVSGSCSSSMRQVDAAQGKGRSASKQHCAVVQMFYA